EGRSRTNGVDAQRPRRRPGAGRLSAIDGGCREIPGARFRAGHPGGEVGQHLPLEAGIDEQVPIWIAQVGAGAEQVVVAVEGDVVGRGAHCSSRENVRPATRAQEYPPNAASPIISAPTSTLLSGSIQLATTESSAKPTNT